MGPPGAARPRRPDRTADPFAGEVTARGVYPLLVLFFIADEPSYGNRIIERIRAMSGGFLSANPNTVYPLLRRLAEQGFVAGRWEDPDRRTRRYYTITPAGEAHLAELKVAAAPYLDGVVASFSVIRETVLGPSAPDR